MPYDQIKNATLKATGQGGQALPPHLQVRKPPVPGATPAPVVTPKPTAPGDTVAPVPPQATAAPANPMQKVYDFFKGDLERERKSAMSNSIADAANRGVYYGTPLTGSEADINTQYLRGLGQLQAGMYQNEQQNWLARLGLATRLSEQAGANMPPMPGGIDWSSLGAIFAPRQGPVSQEKPEIWKLPDLEDFKNKINQPRK